MATMRLANLDREICLYELVAGGGPALLLLHGLGERAPSEVRGPAAEEWAGPIFGLDFTGHGHSDVPPGAGYTSEALLSDADTALAHLGGCTVVGRGLGAYVALMLAGTRPEAVRGVVLCDGPGLAGGGPWPSSRHVPGAAPKDRHRPDGLALAELAHEIRPVDYATAFVRRAVRRSGLAHPVVVSAVARPPWLAAVAAEPGAREMTLRHALRLFGADTTAPVDA